MLRLLFFLPLAACSGEPETESGLAFSLPELSAADYHWIGTRIYRNETDGDAGKLAWWNAGEDFPSLGIGHFIWFPAGVDAPFDESFPPLFAYLKDEGGPCATAPEWLLQLDPVNAPWQSKQQFDAVQDTEELLQLKSWLAETSVAQARYIAMTLVDRWNALELAPASKQPLTQLLRQLVATRQGLFAAVDYYNFKGLGTNPRERYSGEGWGLVQVLGDMLALQIAANEEFNAVAAFAASAGARLDLRVQNAPPERHEQRWLPGWLERVGAYTGDTIGDTGQSKGAFRVRPYVHAVTSTSFSLRWFSTADAAGKLRVYPTSGNTSHLIFESATIPRVACELGYHPLELALLAERELPTAPFRHEVLVHGLGPGTTYHYEVQQDGALAAGTIRLPGGDDTALRVILYGDSEAEPESAGKHAPWGSDDDSEDARRYPVDQDSAYRENLKVIAARRPDMIAIAGDLVQSGGEQRDWDEFWKLNAALGASVPIYAAPGNHDYFGGPGPLGKFSNPAAHRAINKYQAYFAAASAGDSATYFAIRRGPATFVFLDGNDGLPASSAGDTNWFLNPDESGSVAPDWAPGSAQHEWLEQTLAMAAQASEFIFVVMHASAWSSGVHALPPGFEEGEDPLSGAPLRALGDLFMRYGVNAVFSGHDELYEHSLLQSDASAVASAGHDLHFFVIGTGGDGLRGPVVAASNPHQVFLASRDAAEVVDANGVLKDGGLHYGHIELRLDKSATGEWQAIIEPVYIFPRMNAAGELLGFERRIYDDVTVISGKLVATGASDSGVRQ